MFKAVSIASQSVVPASIYPVIFPFFVLPHEYYDPDTSTFVAPFTGMYNFQATIAWSSSSPNTMVTVFIQKNGLNTKFSASTMAPIAGAYVTTIQGSLSLQVGQKAIDAVSIAIQSSQNITILGSAPYPTPITYFQGQRAC